MEYNEFLKSKWVAHATSGFDINISEINDKLFHYQKDIVKWALKKGKAALFAGTGLGKTAMQLEWARHVHEETQLPILILAPLAVSQQTIREGVKFGIDVNLAESQKDVINGVNISNYEKLHHFDPSTFSGIVLDESSILKSFDSKYKQLIIDMFRDTPYKLACTATPAPNDYVELGNHSEFLNILSRVEMLATYFVHDGGDTSKWRLKGHAESKFWEWVASWAVVITKPSDLGYSDEGFELPKLHMHEIIVESPINAIGDQMSMFAEIAKSLTERRTARRDSMDNRIKAAVELINDEQWLVWCDLNAESEMLKHSIDGAVEVKGSDKDAHKVKSALDFSQGNLKYLVSKASIFGFGLNFQSCHNMIFVGLSDSYEQLYQAIRRCWRFGQKEEVNCYIITSEAEGAVKANIARKEEESEKMIAEMVQHTQKILTEEIHGSHRETIEYSPEFEMIIPKWLIEGGY